MPDARCKMCAVGFGDFGSLLKVVLREHLSPDCTIRAAAYQQRELRYYFVDEEYKEIPSTSQSWLGLLVAFMKS